MAGLTIYTVYKNPADFPNKYVVRRWENDIPKELIIVTDTLEEARAAIPPNLYQMLRMPGDLPVIVETWF